MSKVFLGGTCNKTDWREELIPLLKCEYFNPVITDREWTEEDRLNEINQRKASDIVLYVITPRMTGLYSIAEMVDDSNNRPDSTVVFIRKTDINDEGKTIQFIPSIAKSMAAIETLVKGNGATVCYNLQQVVDHLNSFES